MYAGYIVVPGGGPRGRRVGRVDTNSTRGNRHRCASSHNEVPRTSQTPVRGGSRVAIYWRGWGAVMVSKCSNPSCSASFRHLKEGRLFRLENDPALRSKSNRVEYFWLCHRCSSTLTLRLREDGTVVTVLLPEAIRGVPEGVALTSTDRKQGLLLRTVSSTLPKQLGGRIRTRLKEAGQERPSTITYQGVTPQ